MNIVPYARIRDEVEAWLPHAEPSLGSLIDQWSALRASARDRGRGAEITEICTRLCDPPPGFGRDFGPEQRLIAAAVSRAAGWPAESSQDKSGRDQVTAAAMKSFASVAASYIRGGPLTPATMLALHRHLMPPVSMVNVAEFSGDQVRTGLRFVKAGEFRSSTSHMPAPDSTMIELCPPATIPAELAAAAAAHHRHLHAAVPADIAAAWFHERFLYVHPFMDGNGRLARALAQLVALRTAGVPFAFDAPRQEQYLPALRQARAGQPAALTRLFAGAIKDSLNAAVASLHPG